MVTGLVGHLQDGYRDDEQDRTVSIIEKLKSHAERWGWRRTAFAVLMRAVNRILRVELYVVRTRAIADTSVNNPCNSQEIHFRPLSKDEIVSAADDVAMNLDEEFVEKALRQKNAAIGAFDRNRLVAYMWYSMTEAPHTDELNVRVAAPYYYSYNLFARPEYRGKRIVPAMLLYCDEHAMRMGYTDRAAYVDVTNFASLAMTERLGSQIIGYIGYAHWFGRYLFYRSNSVARIGFEFTEVGE